MPRVRCLGCGNEDAETLAYLQVEEDPEARVYSCERCGHYLPVIDARGRRNIAPAVERAALVHLDLLAQRHGARPLAAPAPIYAD